MNLPKQYPSEKKPPEVYFYFGWSLAILFYVFSPIRLATGFIFQIQSELIVFVTVLSLTGCSGILIKRVYSSDFLKEITAVDLLLFACFTCLLLQMIVYPVDTEYVLTIICLSATYYLFRHLPSQWLTYLLCLFPLLVVVQIIYGYNRLAYPWQGLSDITGSFNNTGIFGGFVAMGFISALGLIFSVKQPVIRIVLGLLLIPITIQLIYSQSRAAWVAAAVGTLILLLPAIRKLTKSKATILISILLIVCVFFSFKFYHLKKDSADGRLLIWTVSWNMIKERPLTGWGPGGFQKNYLLWQGEYFKNHPDSSLAALADDIVYPFNEFLKIGVEQGIVGLLFALGIIFFIFGNPASAPVLRAILASLIGFSCFSYPAEIVAFQVLSIFCLAGIAGQSATIVKWRNPLKKSRAKRLVVCLIVSCCGFVSFAAFNYYANVKKWNRIIHSYSPENDQKIAELQVLYPAFKHNDRFVFIYGKALYDAGRYDEAIPFLEAAKDMFPRTQALLLLGKSYEKTNLYSNALRAWESASCIKPSLFMPHYNRAKLYFKLQDYKQAQQEANILLNKKIKIDNPEIDRIKREARDILNFQPPSN
ncbi:MAG: O-antigen ligase family protein [Dysgonamonadaceae bacterium]|nr:O-antigen ligase family protein [Dysgonamonadaceae bacterium]